MLTVSLHHIRINAPVGLYSQELVLNNHFEVDVDVSVAATLEQEWPLVDYTQLNSIVREAFRSEEKFLETIVKDIGMRIKATFPETAKVKVVLRKLNPPMPGNIGYAQVMFEG